MNLKKTALAIVAGILLLSAYVNCSKNIYFAQVPTETSALNGIDQNLPRTGATVATNPLQSSQFSKLVMNKLCAKVASCVPGANIQDCESEILTSTNPYDWNISQKFSFPRVNPVTARDFVNFNEVIAANQAGVISPKSPHWENCLAQIDLLSCTDPEMQKGFQPQYSFPYSELPYVAPALGSPPDCLSAF